MFDRDEFEQTKLENAAAQTQDGELKRLALDFVTRSDQYGYGYQWTWLGMPIIQLPADIIATQEIIWKTQPDVIIETGVAWGGSVVLYASILQLIGKGKVIAIDKVLPQKNIDAIMAYPFSNRISLVEGSSAQDDVVDRVKAAVKDTDTVMVVLDSNHSHDHVLEELRTYAPLVSEGHYLIVSDTIVEDIPRQSHRPRPWGPGNNPKTAVWEYLTETDRFEEDPYINSKLLTTYSPGGYLKCKN